MHIPPQDIIRLIQQIRSQRKNYVLLTLHQVCTPLTVIKGYVSLMQEGNYDNVSKEIQEALDIVQKSVNGLVQTVQDTTCQLPATEDAIVKKFKKRK